MSILLSNAIFMPLTTWRNLIKVAEHGSALLDNNLMSS